MRVTRAKSDKEVKALAKKAGAYNVGGVPGLVLWVQAGKNGDLSASWKVRIRRGNTKVTPGLGPYPEVTVAEARSRARAVLEAYERGEDPKQIHKKGAGKELPKETRQTVEVLFFQWLEVQKERKRWKNEDDYKHAEQRARNYVFPVIGAKEVSAVTWEDVGRGVLAPISLTKPATAEKVRRLLNPFFRWCSAQGYIDQTKRLPTDAGMLKDYLPVMRNTASTHYAMCPVEMLPDFVAELVKPGRFNQVGSMALLFAILTNSRLANVCSTSQLRHNYASWDDIDEQGRVWTIPAEKMKCPENGEHRIPLSGAAMKILGRLSELGLRAGEIVFPNSWGSPLSDGAFRKIIKTINAERKAAGLPEFVDEENGKPITQHGTSRATFRTWASDNGIDKDLAEKALHHITGGKLGKAYDRGDALERRRVVAEQWAQFCLSKSPANWAEVQA